VDLFETGEARRVSREEAAAQLRTLADDLSRHNSLEVQHEGRRVTVRVPDTVRLKLEIELEDDEGELEIELSW
jgi:amphi-Trp domain-containing protein